MKQTLSRVTPGLTAFSALVVHSTPRAGKGAKERINSREFRDYHLG